MQFEAGRRRSDSDIPIIPHHETWITRSSTTNPEGTGSWGVIWSTDGGTVGTWIGCTDSDITIHLNSK
ncbi:MAG: hypothetical protein ACD_78C00287G0002 [uncultured bacterium (gcode 4)]|uniref:Uncharacterized protein n=1 Tax=uncultured bacterium (gcode 4) TaxID=1234023 RepID=K1XX14_9BACT|nr:MAG: hypothetical protein ACD_78C00287G0002 [uncultured bacterium (gcode 4)]